MMPKLLALDLSLAGTGWALLDGKGPPRFGTVYPQHQDFARAMATFAQFLEDAYPLMRWDAMAWERPILLRTDTPDKIAGAYGLVGIAAAFAGKHRIRWERVTVDEVKIAVCGELWKEGRKKVDKIDMLNAARDIHDWKVSTHHEADAGGVGLVAWEALGYP